MENILPYRNLNLSDLPEEVWISIRGFEGLYEVSNMGRVKSLNRTVNHPRYGNKTIVERLLKQTKLKSGYLSVCFHKDGKDKHFRVHRLVALHHVPNPLNKYEVNHLKGIKIDNRASELEWSTRLENISHSISTGLTNNTGINSSLYGLKGILSYQAKKINQYTLQGKYIKTWDCIEDAVKSIGLSRSCVRRNCSSKGFYWKMFVGNADDIIIKKKWQRA